MRSTELRGYLTGLILGDGYIDKGVTKRAFRIKSTNFDFIDKIERDLKSCTNFKMKVDTIEGRNKGGISHKPYKELYIKAHPYFNKRYNFFYDDYRNRRITTEALSWLNDAGLANWYMSDGYIVRVGITKGKIQDRRVEIATDRYSEKDVDKIINFFKDRYGYDVWKVKRKNGVYRVRFSLLSAQHFFLRIADHVVPSMKYKLNLCYNYQPKWMVDEYYHLMKEITECEAPTIVG